MDIRDAGLRDAAEIAHVQVASWRAAYRGLMPESMLVALDPEERCLMWQRVLAQPRSDTLVSGSPVVGFCNLLGSRVTGRAREEAEISAIYLVPELWRKGIGRRLLEATLCRASERGYRTVGLWVLRDNERARCFYEAVGFVWDGQERVETSQNGTSLHELRYRIELARQGG